VEGRGVVEGRNGVLPHGVGYVRGVKSRRELDARLGPIPLDIVWIVRSERHGASCFIVAA